MGPTTWVRATLPILKNGRPEGPGPPERGPLVRGKGVYRSFGETPEGAFPRHRGAVGPSPGVAYQRYSRSLTRLPETATMGFRTSVVRKQISQS